MRRYRVGDIVVANSETHKRIHSIVGHYITLEWWDGTGRQVERVHVTHLTFISKKPTDDFNYFYLQHPK